MRVILAATLAGLLCPGLALADKCLTKSKIGNAKALTVTRMTLYCQNKRNSQTLARLEQRVYELQKQILDFHTDRAARISLAQCQRKCNKDFPSTWEDKEFCYKSEGVEDTRVFCDRLSATVQQNDACFETCKAKNPLPDDTE
jgi:hypothetical protein